MDERVHITSGMMFPTKNWLLLGLSTAIIFPIITIAEMIVSPRSHNLWFLELDLYALFGLASVGGALVGRLIYGVLSSSNKFKNPLNRT